MYYFFFFKQKAAYEMRISDWSSDVCSSDLNLVAALDAAREPALGRLLYALGIRHVGETTARDLARHFGSVDAVMDADEESLLQVNDVGPVVSGSIIRFFKEPHNRQIIAGLAQAGVHAVPEAVPTDRKSTRLNYSP